MLGQAQIRQGRRANDSLLHAGEEKFDRWEFYLSAIDPIDSAVILDEQFRIAGFPKSSPPGLNMDLPQVCIGRVLFQNRSVIIHLLDSEAEVDSLLCWTVLLRLCAPSCWPWQLT